MPQYYVHVYDRNGHNRDHVGTELADIHEARSETVKVARELWHLCDDLPPGALSTMAIEVANQTGQPVLIVPFSAAIG
jgi:hypothetical protein